MPSSPSSHDQNFKNLILDYPRQALQFFAPEEAADVDESAIITPLRQEQLKNRLGDRFHELDVPLKVEWPDGRRAALLFVLEEESDLQRFSIHRLGRYCLELAELMDTTRVVPVVIFLRSSPGGCHHEISHPRCPVMRIDARSVTQPILKYWQAARRSRCRITGQPVGTGTGAVHCGVAARLCSWATRHSPRLALHRLCTLRGREIS